MLLLLSTESEALAASPVEGC